MTTTETTGRRRFLCRAARVASLIAAAGLLGMGPGSTWGNQKKSKRAPYAVVAGTVFRPPGFAMAGAQVTLSPVERPEGKGRIKQQKISTDGRGEFAFRVPAEAREYKVAVTAEGFARQEKEASVQGDERIDLYFLLEAETGEP
jgi:hypothetical protein